MAKFKNLILKELGNTTDTYPLRTVRREVSPYRPDIEYAWEFSTENYDYYIHIFNEYPDFLTVDFSTDQTGNELTNEGNPFKVTSTVIEAAMRTYEQVNEHEKIDMKGFRFKGIPKKGSDDDKNTQRNKLYKTFIKNQFPSAKIESLPFGAYEVTL
jgi:hypothetical protein